MRLVGWEGDPAKGAEIWAVRVPKVPKVWGVQVPEGAKVWRVQPAQSALFLQPVGLLALCSAASRFATAPQLVGLSISVRLVDSGAVSRFDTLSAVSRFAAQPSKKAPKFWGIQVPRGTQGAYRLAGLGTQVAKI